MKIHFKTFGCKVNQCETNDMIARVGESGCETVPSPARADIVVINSCTVTSNADRKTKQYLRKCMRVNPRPKIFLTGCLAGRNPAGLRKEFPGIDFFGNKEKENVRKVLGMPAAGNRNLLPAVFSSRTRAFVKIQDGCDGKCSYCIVPKVRPELRSKNFAGVISEVKKYVSAGYKEIVLCGIRLGKYGSKSESGNRKLPDLITELEKIDGLCRIRLSSIELHDITDDLIRLMEKSAKLCRHFHIPLQSGDDRILKDMNRPYDTEKFFDKIKKIREKIPDVGITTDVIIGYPTDTDDTLKNSYNFAKKCAFSRLHLFKFSRRPGTKADSTEKNCPEKLIKTWQGKFYGLDRRLRGAFLKKFSGKKLEVLTESNGYGYTSNYLYLKLPASYPVNEIVSYEK